MINANLFNTILLEWYFQMQRNLPWRQTKDPYRIWLSEIILQQTRVNQGLKYYEAFVSKFPDIHTLAQSSEDQVLKLWQGLGYYTRARNLHATAQIISQTHKGIFPGDYKALLKLPGIGQYTAAAISSFAYEEAIPVIDGNVYRFIARFSGLDEPINTPRAHSLFTQHLTPFIEATKPSHFNQGIMEFGALQCTVSNPKCNSCPFAAYCHAHQQGKTESYPVKIPKPKIRARYFYYFIITDGTSLFIQKRNKQDIWKNLYEFPLIETPRPLLREEIIQSAAQLLPGIGNDPAYSLSIASPIHHQLTHQRITATFCTLSLKTLPGQTVYQKIPGNTLHEYAIPRLLEIYCQQNNLLS